MGKTQAEVLEHRCIWDRSEHAAFPDLIRYRGAWYSEHEGPAAIYLARVRLDT